jgi:hypothetical protein
MLTAHRAPARAPRLVELPAQSVAVVHTLGEPRAAANSALPALYAAVYHVRSLLKREGRGFKIEHLRARWPDAHLVPKEHWHAAWALPVPEGGEPIPQRKPGVSVEREQWEYGTVAEIVHVGSYEDEGASVRRLHAFIAEQGYEVAGPHEEEYLTTRRARVQRTLIRYPVRRKGSEPS